MEHVKRAWHSYKHHIHREEGLTSEMNRLLQQVVRAEQQMAVSVCLRSHEKVQGPTWEGTVSVQDSGKECDCHMSRKQRYKLDQLCAKFQLKCVVPFCLLFPRLIILTPSTNME